MPSTLTNVRTNDSAGNFDIVVTEPDGQQTPFTPDQRWRLLLLAIYNTRLKRIYGVGSPQTVVGADPGAVYVDVAGPGFWVKQSGINTATGWLQIATGPLVGGLILTGNGSPEGVTFSDPGNIYIDMDNGTLWSKLSGVATNTGWGVVFRVDLAGGFVIGGDQSGNARGANALDVQSTRTNANQVASGAEAVAIGGRNIASGAFSNAVGKSNRATYSFTSAFGYENGSYAVEASTFGYYNKAYSYRASAVGAYNRVYGYCDYSSAFGHYNIIGGTSPNCVAVGSQNLVYAGYCVAVGMGNNFLLSSDYSTCVGYNNLAFNYQVAAFGRRNNLTGAYAVGIGHFNSVGSQGYSNAVGSRNTVAAYVGSAFGYGNYIADPADDATAVGSYNQISANSGQSSIFGYNNEITPAGPYATNCLAIGSNNECTDSYAVAVGNSNHSTGFDSLAVGYNNHAGGIDGAAVGYNNYAVGNFGSALGNSNFAQGIASSAVGYSNFAGYDGASAVGFENYSDALSLNASTFGYYNAVYGSNDCAAFGNANFIGAATIRGMAFGIGNYQTTATSAARQVSVGVDNAVYNTQSAAVGVYNTIAAGTYGYCAAVGVGNSTQSDYAAAVGVQNVVSAASPYSAAVGYTNDVSGYQGCAVGVANASSGINAPAIGFACYASGDYSSAIGNGSTASGLRATALGHFAAARVDLTTNICGPQIIRKDNADGPDDAFWKFAGVETVLMTDEVDFKGLFTRTLTLPAGCHFWLDEVFIIATDTDTIAVQPTVSFGITGTPTKYVNAQLTTALTANLTRQRYDTGAVPAIDGEASLLATIDVVATATKLKGRFGFRGLLIEDE